MNSKFNVANVHPMMVALHGQMDEVGQRMNHYIIQGAGADLGMCIPCATMLPTLLRDLAQTIEDLNTELKIEPPKSWEPHKTT